MKREVSPPDENINLNLDLSGNLSVSETKICCGLRYISKVELVS